LRSLTSDRIFFAGSPRSASTGPQAPSALPAARRLGPAAERRSFFLAEGLVWAAAIRAQPLVGTGYLLNASSVSARAQEAPRGSRASDSLALRLAALKAFTTARWRARTLRTRADIARFQTGRLAELTGHASSRFGYYRPFRDRSFEDWPVVDKAVVTEHFDQMNVFGIPASQVRAMLAAGQERGDGFVVGQSTGTSGNRGYYVISDRERFVWLGTILAKTLPDALWRQHRVALALPGLSSLYRSAGAGSRIQLGFFDLALGVDAWANQLDRFAPDTLVAPPKVLRLLAERGRLHAQNIFSGAEVLDPLDRAAIEQATGRRVREIYMATEGLFGVSCRHGTLHLAEDVVHFGWEPPLVGSRLSAPIVTDFTRRSQALIRYRMNDLMELDPAPCACGSPLQAVRQIAGRADDILMLETPHAREVMITPDVFRNAIVDAHPGVRDFRVTQTGPSSLEICLEANASMDMEAAVRAKLAERLAPFGVAPGITVRRGLSVPFDHKLRRVRRAAS